MRSKSARGFVCPHARSFLRKLESGLLGYSLFGGFLVGSGVDSVGIPRGCLRLSTRSPCFYPHRFRMQPVRFIDFFGPSPLWTVREALFRVGFSPKKLKDCGYLPIFLILGGCFPRKTDQELRLFSIPPQSLVERGGITWSLSVFAKRSSF